MHRWNLTSIQKMSTALLSRLHFGKASQELISLVVPLDKDPHKVVFFA